MDYFRASVTRRGFLAGAAQASVLGLAWGAEPLWAAPKTRWFKIGACEWCLRRGDPSSLDVAKQIGLDGVQVNMGTVANQMHLRQPEVQRAYREASLRTGVEIASLAIGEMNNVPLKSDPRAAQWLDESIDVAQALGVTVVMPACFARGDLDMNNTQEIDHLVRVLKSVAPKAERAKITIGLESYLSAEDTLRILDRVGSPALAMYYDVGNSTDKGRDIVKEIRLMKGRICEFHAKDAGFMLGQGRIDFKAVRQAIDDIGFSGWIQIEAAAPHNLIDDYRAHYQFLRSVFPERP